MAKLGLVTVLYNSNHVLEGFFKSLSAQSFKDYHLYIVDNTPSKETDACLSKLFHTYQITAYTHTKTVENVGIAKGNNIGIEAALNAGVAYVLLLNNDIEFDQIGLISELVTIAEVKNEALVIPKIYFYDTRKVWLAGGEFIWWKAMGKHIGEWKDDSPIYDKELHCDYAPTCFMLIRADTIREIGIMDEKYFTYFDDTDFCFRAVKNGYKILYLPQFKILHKVGSSTGGYDSLFGIYYGTRNRIYFVRKHYGMLNKIITFIFIFASRLIKYVKYNNNQRRELLKGIKDGLDIKIVK